MCACRQGHNEIMLMVLGAVKDPKHVVNLQNKHGWSSLMIASQKGYAETVALLLQNGAHVNMQENFFNDCKSAWTHRNSLSTAS